MPKLSDHLVDIVRGNELLTERIVESEIKPEDILIVLLNLGTRAGILGVYRGDAKPPLLTALYQDFAGRIGSPEAFLAKNIQALRLKLPFLAVGEDATATKDAIFTGLAILEQTRFRSEKMFKEVLDKMAENAPEVKNGLLNLNMFPLSIYISQKATLVKVKEAHLIAPDLREMRLSEKSFFPLRSSKFQALAIKGQIEGIEETSDYYLEITFSSTPNDQILNDLKKTLAKMDSQYPVDIFYSANEIQINLVKGFERQTFQAVKNYLQKLQRKYFFEFNLKQLEHPPLATNI